MVNIRIILDSSLEEGDLELHCHPQNTSVLDIKQLIQDYTTQNFLQVRGSDHATHAIRLNDVYTFRIENKLLHVYTTHGTYTHSERLYQIKQRLNHTFLQISKSEIINLSLIDHLVLHKSGIIEIIFIDGASTYSSRRYLKLIKEALKL
ncbi:LytTR family DNA-binding domain-containing protein [Staphylococcus delphini]|uniref:LytTR family DNA-binding domain-containing protein n=1 Tax=Staphylococcus delphini TaxID=53344 RepID=UPI0023B20FB3|nr:LytTR family DNA-binding domain-containing protein [Staphylococcus delphini]MDE9751788.1 LytTR family DNA-binding domain-containing protein [Staphylococcus delphini]MDE9789065.1 LytTR family DNA-binding domain-containing protein [Staphylococcus delphini]MDE9791303.1 LytTR family DNA-binding domain-containing protein [Staphylococcus delphini]MDE9793632.1 LytTR family DNA-binding domain-containing protein [Staphylococcus delphini]MDE9796018.1 LytTR family DNA-binding domain-containing protein